ncbi:MAG: cytochrome c [Polyangiaceae bacterium]
MLNTRVKRPLVLVLLACASLSFSLGGCAKKPQEAVDGAALFSTNCARCHGATGGGGLPSSEGSPAPRNFRDRAFQTARTDDELRHTIVRGKGASMPPFGAMFTDEQLQALVRQIRSFDDGKRP